MKNSYYKILDKMGDFIPNKGLVQKIKDKLQRLIGKKPGQQVKKVAAPTVTPSTSNAPTLGGMPAKEAPKPKIR